MANKSEEWSESLLGGKDDTSSTQKKFKEECCDVNLSALSVCTVCDRLYWAQISFADPWKTNLHQLLCLYFCTPFFLIQCRVCHKASKTPLRSELNSRSWRSKSDMQCMSVSFQYIGLKYNIRRSDGSKEVDNDYIYVYICMYFPFSWIIINFPVMRESVSV